jgi:hypothetical protein
MAMQGAAKDRELPLSQHAVMTSMKRSGNPACRAVPDARSTLDRGAGILVLSWKHTRRGLAATLRDTANHLAHKQSPYVIRCASF